MSPGTTVCPSCGVQRHDDDEPCPECGTVPPTDDGLGKEWGGTGAAKRTQPRGNNKNPWLAAALSILLTGVGQIYVGRVARGLGWLFGAIGVAAFLAFNAPQLGDVVYLAPVLSAVDAWLLAS